MLPLSEYARTAHHTIDQRMIPWHGIRDSVSCETGSGVTASRSYVKALQNDSLKPGPVALDKSRGEDCQERRDALGTERIAGRQGKERDWG